MLVDYLIYIYIHTHKRDNIVKTQFMFLAILLKYNTFSIPKIIIKNSLFFLSVPKLFFLLSLTHEEYDAGMIM